MDYVRLLWPEICTGLVFVKWVLFSSLVLDKAGLWRILGIVNTTTE